MEENKKVSEKLGELIGQLIGHVGVCFISAAFIMWGWNTIAPHLNAPTFGYWEIFAMRMGLTHVMAILWQRPKK